MFTYGGYNNDYATKNRNAKQLDKQNYYFEFLSPSEDCIKRLESLIKSRFRYAIYQRKNMFIYGYIVFKQQRYSSMRALQMYVGESTSVDLTTTTDSIIQKKIEWGSDYVEIGDITSLYRKTPQIKRRSMEIKNNHSILEYCSNPTRPTVEDSSDSSSEETLAQHWVIEDNLNKLLTYE